MLKQKINNKGNVFSYTLDILKNKKSLKLMLISFVIALIVYSFLYGIWIIPVAGLGIMRMSEIGLLDYVFVVLVSLIVAFLVTLISYERSLKIKSKSFASTTGVVAGVVSAICPVCQGITFVALGSTIGNIPLGPAIPYLGIIKLASLGLLMLALFLKMDSIYTKECITCKIIPKTKKVSPKISKDPFLLRNNFAFTGVLVIAILLITNVLLIPKAFAGLSFGGTSGSLSLGNFQYGSKLTLKSMPLAAGEQPVISGYKTKVKSLPTISEISIQPSTGDSAQDLLNNVIPRGTPWYGQEAGVSFDDPIAAQKLWAKGRAIQLNTDQEKRWERIVNSFTCDYCCGSPQSPTIITRCGCAHSQAAQGMAKWFVKNYGDKYSDEEIYGEMARWYAVWYPGPTVKRILQEAQN